MDQLYCPKCQRMTDTDSLELFVAKNQRIMLRGTCLECGTRKSGFQRKQDDEFSDRPTRVSRKSPSV